MRPLVIAHRGASALAPENTMPALAAAALAGADMIEIDVQVAAGGAGVVIGYATVDRTTDGSGLITDLEPSEVRRLDAGSWFDPAYRGTGVPLFGDVLALMRRFPRLELLLELKGTWPSGPASALLAAIEEAGVGERVLAQSAVPETVAVVGELAPALRRGLLVGRVPGGVEELPRICADLGVVACNPHGGLLLDHPGLVGLLHAHDLRIMVWTLNETAHWAAATDAGVDGIITDRPERLLGWLEGRGVLPGVGSASPDLMSA